MCYLYRGELRAVFLFARIMADARMVSAMAVAESQGLSHVFGGGQRQRGENRPKMFMSSKGNRRGGQKAVDVGDRGMSWWAKSEMGLTVFY